MGRKKTKDAGQQTAVKLRRPRSAEAVFEEQGPKQAGCSVRREAAGSDDPQLRGLSRVPLLACPRTEHAVVRLQGRTWTPVFPDIYEEGHQVTEDQISSYLIKHFNKDDKTWTEEGRRAVGWANSPITNIYAVVQKRTAEAQKNGADPKFRVWPCVAALRDYEGRFRTGWATNTSPANRRSNRHEARNTREPSIFTSNWCEWRFDYEPTASSYHRGNQTAQTATAGRKASVSRHPCASPEPTEKEEPKKDSGVVIIDLSIDYGVGIYHDRRMIVASGDLYQFFLSD